VQELEVCYSKASRADDDDDDDVAKDSATGLM